MPRKKNPNNQYFNSEVEKAILDYNQSTDDRERNRLFRIIYPALLKISQVWYNKIKPTYIELPPEELQMDCVTFMLEKIPMVKEGKGKAFSYLTVTAKNYFILNNQMAYKKKLKGCSLDAISDTFDIIEEKSDRVDEMEKNGLLFDTFLEYVNENFEEMFNTNIKKEFAVCFFNKIKSFQFAEDINRRKILNELAQETGIDRDIVTKHLNKITSHFYSFKDYFENYGIKPKFKEKIFISQSDEEYIRKNYKHYSKHNGLNGISRKLGIKYEVLKNWVKQSGI